MRPEQSEPHRDEPEAGVSSDASALTLEPGFLYRLQLSDGQSCAFDLSQPRQIWVYPPPPPIERLRTSRNDWMLVIDDAVTLRRGQPTTVHVFEEAGSNWTYVSAPPLLIIATSKASLPTTWDWR
jgi:hypothetical protein